MSEKKRTRKKSKVSRLDVTDYLSSAEDVIAYIEARIEQAGNHSMLIDALGDIARARGMTELAQKTGLTREGLYKALARDGNPTFSTVLKVLDAFDVALSLRPAD
jgi:probable addiction module antidote protein